MPYHHSDHHDSWGEPIDTDLTTCEVCEDKPTTWIVHTTVGTGHVCDDCKDDFITSFRALSPGDDILSINPLD